MASVYSEEHEEKGGGPVLCALHSCTSERGETAAGGARDPLAPSEAGLRCHGLTQHGCRGQTPAPSSSHRPTLATSLRHQGKDPDGDPTRGRWMHQNMLRMLLEILHQNVTGATTIAKRKNGML